MKLKVGDFYYGAALAQIAAYPVLSHVHSVGGKDGYYQINGDKLLLIKYATANRGAWRFTFRPDDLVDLAWSADYIVWLVLVCGGETVCLLNEDEVKEVVNCESTDNQWISVESSNGRSMKVAGSAGPLRRRIRHNAFPRDLFNDGRESNKYSWPPLSRLQFYTTWPYIVRTTEDPFFDLSDALGWDVSFGVEKVVYMGLRTYSSDWSVWDGATLRKIEKLIRYDLNFDGFDVVIERTSPELIDQGGELAAQRCADEYLWKLTITVME
ncbi:hypothetical protein [Burkholderia lata]|uniref:Uncharacterized protein n=1 Tax=Burkholderia lata (strain ATCC 17760 / DSM 23089 / LMG 22485 / NCIMB 9086 / R18194 / 383) TaxID=482957 RepID=A0A6P2UFR9_BURL3|nr:hypothetical protein [Burkholderia lata]VWC75693.1 hypothetical protein BLA18109_02875 [Burkholderia lata]